MRRSGKASAAAQALCVCTAGLGLGRRGLRRALPTLFTPAPVRSCGVAFATNAPLPPFDAAPLTYALVAVPPRFRFQPHHLN
jgi:hypothetical protein